MFPLLYLHPRRLPILSSLALSHIHLSRRLPPISSLPFPPPIFLLRRLPVLPSLSLPPPIHFPRRFRQLLSLPVPTLKSSINPPRRFPSLPLLGTTTLLPHHHHLSTTTTSSPFRWTTLLLSAHRSLPPAATLAILCRMLRAGSAPTALALSLVLKASQRSPHPSPLPVLHSLLLRLGHATDGRLAAALLSSYISLAHLPRARQVLDEMPHRTLACWTLMLNAHTHSNLPRTAIALYCAMLGDGIVPDGMALVAAFAACAQTGDDNAVSFGTALEASARKSGVCFDTHVVNSLIAMYANCGRIDTARKLFESLEERNVIAWNTMITGYMKNRDPAAARELFDKIPERNEASWSALISGYVLNCELGKALAVFNEMRAVGVAPNNAALTSTLTACARLGALCTGRRIHLSYLNAGRLRSEVVLSTALIDMYARCGCLTAASLVFEAIAGKTLVTWNVMIMGAAVHGNSQVCFDLFARLLKEGLRPSSETFTGMLTACAHSGWLREGKELYDSMRSAYAVVPRVEHCTCMVQLIGRSGDLREALALIRSSGVTPDVALWGALLTACSFRGDVKLGEFAARQVLLLDPSHSGAYVQLAGIYAKAGMWREALNVRSRMRVSGKRNRPAWSSVEIDGVVHQFHVGCRLHPRLSEIVPVLSAMDGWIQSNHLDI